MLAIKDILKDVALIQPRSIKLTQTFIAKR